MGGKPSRSLGGGPLGGHGGPATHRDRRPSHDPYSRGADQTAAAEAPLLPAPGLRALDSRLLGAIGAGNPREVCPASSRDPRPLVENLFKPLTNL